MDTRTRSSSPAGAEQPRPTPPPVQDKISAYYSLVFPHFTFYIQTLSITIGRRCAPNAATSSTADQSQVDVDLGALKSVSRLHAKIEYDQEEDRFVLAVIGRNGAWVDGVWSGSGTRAPLSERSQIQIASRTFHFILPPPPPPEDTPSPSSQSSANRPRSPSVDITSISPPSSQPSHSPPPINTKLSPPPEPKSKGKTLPQPQLPNSNAIGKSKASSKKRKKGDTDPLPALERPKPEDMPPKPPFTYAQLIYRAIKDIGGKATLQEICTWIMNTHDYYRFTDGAWMSSVRHNLSSGRAFLKMERCGGDRGKGFFWSIDEKHAQALEEQESKFQQAAAAAAQGITILTTEAPTKSRKRDKGALLEPPLKRSVKGDLNGTLPPPLTSAPLSYRGVATSTALSTAPVSCAAGSSNPPVPAVPAAGTPAATGVFPYPSHPHLPHHTATLNQSSPAPMSGPTGTPLNAVNPYAALTQTNWGLHPPVNSSTATASLSTTPTTASPVPSTSMASARHVTSTPGPPLPLPSTPGHTPVPDVVIPIVLGPIPLTHPDYTPNHPNNSAKEGYMVLHERKLILDPDVFAGLTKEMLAELEKMGARTALAVLTNHMVRALKERRAKGRGKERGGRRSRGAGRQGGLARKVGQTQFTNVPSDHTKNMTGAAPGKSTEVDRVVAESMETKPPTSVPGSIPDPIPITGQVTHPIGDGGRSSQAEPGSPLIVVDDSGNEEPATKKRKVEGGLAIATH